MDPEEKEFLLAVWTVFAVITIPLMVACITVFCHSMCMVNRSLRMPR